MIGSTIYRACTRSESMRYVLFVMLMAFAADGFAQREKPMNYRRFDERLFHFGFTIGGNTADFTMFQVPNAYEKFGVKSVTNHSAPGGQVGILTTMKVGTPVVRLRFIPIISFQERILRYEFEDDTQTGAIFNEERIQSTNLDFPLMFQFRTLRVNNFAAYVLAGGQYTVDLQSQQDAGQDFNDPFIKISKHDWQGQVGGGLEFFATYFKFGIELKYSHGWRNVLIQDNTSVSNPIESLYNRVWWLSLIFEG